jgi:hypothetical protein
MMVSRGRVPLLWYHVDCIGEISTRQLNRKLVLMLILKYPGCIPDLGDNSSCVFIVICSPNDAMLQ